LYSFGNGLSGYLLDISPGEVGPVVLLDALVSQIRRFLWGLSTGNFPLVDSESFAGRVPPWLVLSSDFFKAYLRKLRALWEVIQALWKVIRALWALSRALWVGLRQLFRIAAVGTSSS
jgi:hypothetical protein